MKKAVYEAVKKRSGGLCELCGSNQLVEVHHIIHGKNGHELDMKLKRQLQDKYFSMGYTEERVREKMGGKLY